MQKRETVPHIVPQGTLSTVPGVAHDSSAHSPAGAYVQVSPQRTSRVCPAGHPAPLRVREPGAHSPSPLHAPSGSHSHVALQTSDWVPQLPQAAPARVSPGAHSPSSSQTP